MVELEWGKRMKRNDLLKIISPDSKNKILNFWRILSLYEGFNKLF